MTSTSPVPNPHNNMDPTKNQPHCPLPVQRDSYGPPSSRGRDEYSRGYDYSSEAPPPTDNYYSSGEYSGHGGSGGHEGSGSGYRGSPPSNVSGHPPSSGYGSRDYGGGYGSERPEQGYSQPLSGNYRDQCNDYPYDVPPQDGYSNRANMCRQLSPPFSQRLPTTYDGPQGEGRRPYTRNEGSLLPPPGRKSYEQQSGGNESRFYGSQQSPQRQESHFGSSGPMYRGPPDSNPMNQGYSAKGNPAGVYGSSNPPNTAQGSDESSQSRGPPSGSQSGYSSYSVSSYSTGYGSTSQSGGQRWSSVGGSGGSAPSSVGLRPGSRGPVTNTGFMPSQSYTKPGPPF